MLQLKPPIVTYAEGLGDMFAPDLLKNEERLSLFNS